MRSKLEQARELIEKAEGMGCHCEMFNGFVVFAPTLPADMLMTAAGLQTSLKEAIKEKRNECRRST